MNLFYNFYHHVRLFFSYVRLHLFKYFCDVFIMYYIYLIFNSNIYFCVLFFCCRDGFLTICQVRTQGRKTRARSRRDHVRGDGLLPEGIQLCTITAHGWIA